MATKKQEATVDLTEEIPTDLGGEQQSYVPATRSSGALVQNGPVALDLDGVRPPFLQMVYGPGIGTLSAEFDARDLVLAGKYCVSKKNDRLTAIFLNIKQFVKEWMDGEAFAEKRTPATFANMAEAAAAGFQTNWGPRGSGIKPNVSRAMEITMLIRKPEGSDCPLFSINIGDEHEYALCLLSVDKGAYKTLINDIGLIANSQLKAGLHNGLWEVRTDVSKPNHEGRQFQNIRADFKGLIDPKIAEGIVDALAVPVNDTDDDPDAFQD